MYENVGVGILSYNHPELTARCVSSVLSLTGADRVFLCHNGSQTKFIEKLRQQFPEISHVVMDENKGFSGGANKLLHKVFKKFEWCLFITNDCLLLNPPSQPSSLGLYSPKIYARKIDRIDSIGGFFIPALGKLGHLKSLKMPSHFLGVHFYTPGTAFYLDRDTFLKVGNFQEALGTYWEDVDFSMRVQKSGRVNSIHLQTELLHGIGKTCHKDPHYTSYLYQRNRKLVSWRYTSNIKKMILAPTLMWVWSRLLLNNLRPGRRRHLKLLASAIFFSPRVNVSKK